MCKYLRSWIIIKINEDYLFVCMLRWWLHFVVYYYYKMESGEINWDLCILCSIYFAISRIWNLCIQKIFTVKQNKIKYNRITQI